MGSVLRWLSYALFGLVSLFLIWFGYTYASVQDMLWFHAAAVPEALRGEVKPLYFALMKPLYFALMKLIGGASAALGLLGLYTIAMPMRRGVVGSAGALTAMYLLVFLVAAQTAEQLADDTGAPTSWHIMGVLMVLTLAGLLMHALSQRLGAHRENPETPANPRDRSRAARAG